MDSATLQGLNIDLIPSQFRNQNLSSGTPSSSPQGLSPVPGYNFSQGVPDLYSGNVGGTQKYFAPEGFSAGGGYGAIHPNLATAAGGTPYTDPYAAQAYGARQATSQDMQRQAQAGGGEYSGNTAQPYAGYNPKGYLFNSPPNASSLASMYNYTPGQKPNIMSGPAGPLLMVGGAALGGALAGGAFSGAGGAASAASSDAGMLGNLANVGPISGGVGAGAGAGTGAEAAQFAASQGMGGGVFGGAMGGLTGPGATGASLDFDTIGQGAALTNNAAGTAGGVSIYPPMDLTSPASAGLDLGQVGGQTGSDFGSIYGGGNVGGSWAPGTATGGGTLAGTSSGGGLGGFFNNLGSDISNVGSNLYNHPLMPALGAAGLVAKLYQGKQLQDIANRSSQLANPMAQPQRAGAQQNINSFMSGGQDITKTPFMQGGLQLADERTKAQLAMMGMTGSGNAITAYNTNLSNQLNAGIPNYLNTLGMLGGYNQGPGYAGNLYGQYAAGSTATLPMGLSALTQGISQNPGDQSTANQWLLAQMANMNNPNRYGTA